MTSLHIFLMLNVATLENADLVLEGTVAQWAVERCASSSSTAVMWLKLKANVL